MCFLKKWLYCVALVVCSNVLWGQISHPQTPYTLVRVHFSDTHTVERLAALGVECDHGYYQKGRFLENVFASAELERIQAAGFICETLIQDMNAHYLAHRDNPVAESRSEDCTPSFLTDWVTPTNYTYGSMGGFHTWAEMQDVLDDMRAKFPHLITAKTPISADLNTAEGRPIFWLRISDNPDQDEQEPEALFTGLHHAREPASMSQILFFMWYLLENYATNTEIRDLVDHSELYFVPCVNPDGYVYNETQNPTGGGLWRKNRGSNGGVDLNRNYGNHWGHDNSGSSPSPSAETYRGPSAFSEPETQAIKLFCESHQFQVALNAHAFSNLLIFPYGYNSQPTPDHATFQEITSLMTLENQYSNGLAAETVGYAANGNSDDWMYETTPIKGKVFSITPEIGTSLDYFWPPESRIDGLNKEMMWSNLTAVRVLHHYGIAKVHTVALTALSTPISFKLKRYGLKDGSITVSLIPISGNIDEVGVPEVFTLAPFASAQGQINLVLAPTITEGEEVIFLLSVSDGTLSHTDTIQLTYLGNGLAPAQVIFEEQGNDIGQWTTPNNWNTTDQHFVSEGTSITDSPDGPYPSNRDARLTLKNPIHLETALEAKLTFFARWDIEENYDYAEVLASTNGTSFIPLCGQFTHIGSANQDAGQPVYEGKQLEWVEEEISLNEYLGMPLWLRFRMVSDGAQSGEGFYFDSLQVRVVTNASGAYPVSVSKKQLSIMPNPAVVGTPIQVLVPSHIAGTQEVLDIYNVFGEKVAERIIQGAASSLLETTGWNPGIYVAQVRTHGEMPISMRFILVE